MKVKVARSTHFMDNVIPFIAYLLIFESNASITWKAIGKYILHTIKKAISLTLSVYLGFNAKLHTN